MCESASLCASCRAKAEVICEILSIQIHRTDQLEIHSATPCVSGLI